ncbi:hypothetical protein J1605_022660 [Eschrichtius robustus]|uniref:Myosin X N-terminal SH3 domain-containing protein n=1 Tax=Eschrichtius robustus TaxID=9764 RepID=A0AB34H8K8_ESCRO|nr:hypothetical protein J1605_022660 [Eschrichtius robustus]
MPVVNVLFGKELFANKEIGTDKQPCPSFWMLPVSQPKVGIGGLRQCDVWKEYGIRNRKDLRPGLVTSCVTLGKDGTRVWLRENGQHFPSTVNSCAEGIVVFRTDYGQGSVEPGAFNRVENVIREEADCTRWPPRAQERQPFSAAAEAAFLASLAKPAVGRDRCRGKEVSPASSFSVSGCGVSEQQLAWPPKSGPLGLSVLVSFLVMTFVLSLEVTFQDRGTASPEVSPGPSGTASPEVSPGPSGDTASPEVSPGPSGDTASPEVSPGPSGTASPEVSPGPSDTASPEVSPGPSDNSLSGGEPGTQWYSLSGGEPGTQWYSLSGGEPRNLYLQAVQPATGFCAVNPQLVDGFIAKLHHFVFPMRGNTFPQRTKIDSGKTHVSCYQEPYL